MPVRRLRQLWEHLHSSYWFVPGTMAIAAVGLAAACLELDRGLRENWWPKPGWMYSGGPAGARAVLSTVAGSIITVASTTFSITVTTLSLASNQFGPRLLRSFIRDTGNQIVLGTFTATFLFCLLILRTVRGLEDDKYVPHISVTVSVALAVLSVGVLIYFIHHVAESIQVSHLAQRVSTELNASVARLFPDLGGPSAPRTAAPSLTGAAVVNSTSEGYVQAIDTDTLLEFATANDLVISLRVRPGDYLFPGLEIARVLPATSPRIQTGIGAALSVGRVRTTFQDAEFGFLQLTEIALRALSPSINDPFTAILCLDHLTAAMVRLAHRRLPDAVRCDRNGRARLIARPYNWQELTHAAFGQIAGPARTHPTVLHRLRTAVVSVHAQAQDPELRAALSHELEQLHAD
jgi:uncharacterized membrane protein